MYLPSPTATKACVAKYIHLFSSTKSWTKSCILSTVITTFHVGIAKYNHAFSKLAVPPGGSSIPDLVKNFDRTNKSSNSNFFDSENKVSLTNSFATSSRCINTLSPFCFAKNSHRCTFVSASYGSGNNSTSGSRINSNGPASPSTMTTSTLSFKSESGGIRPPLSILSSGIADSISGVDIGGSVGLALALALTLMKASASLEALELVEVLVALVALVLVTALESEEL